MKAIRVYRNPHCARCARFAKAHHVLDWFGKVDPSTDTPRTGPLRMGEVVVEDLSNGQIHRGADDIELIARNIPAYLPLRLLLKVPGFRRYVSHEVSGMPAPFKRMNIFSWNDSMRLTKTQSHKIHSKAITRKDNLP